jgi:hypothetical protein
MTRCAKHDLIGDVCLSKATVYQQLELTMDRS